MEAHKERREQLERQEEARSSAAAGGGTHEHADHKSSGKGKKDTETPSSAPCLGPAAKRVIGHEAIVATDDDSSRSKKEMDAAVDVLAFSRTVNKIDSSLE